MFQKGHVRQEKKRYKDIPIDFETKDGISLQFDDNEFDLIVSFQVIEHIVEQDLYLNGLKRVLAPGRIVLFTTPNALSRLFSGMGPRNRFHVMEFAPSKLENFLKQHFPVVQILGLFAEEPLYLMAINRVDRKRKRIKYCNALRKAKSLTSTSNAVIEDRNREKPEMFIQMFADKYGTRDLFYKLDGLGESMDLLAFCMADENILRKSIVQLVQQSL